MILFTPCSSLFDLLLENVPVATGVGDQNLKVGTLVN